MSFRTEHIDTELLECTRQLESLVYEITVTRNNLAKASRLSIIQGYKRRLHSMNKDKTDLEKRIKKLNDKKQENRTTESEF